jgi:hypothetical protein
MVLTKRLHFSFTVTKGGTRTIAHLPIAEGLSFRSLDRRIYDCKLKRNPLHFDVKSAHCDAESNHSDAESCHSDADSTHSDAKSAHHGAESEHFAADPLSLKLSKVNSYRCLRKIQENLYGELQQRHII